MHADVKGVLVVAVGVAIGLFALQLVQAYLMPKMGGSGTAASPSA